VPTDAKWAGRRFDLVCVDWGGGKYAADEDPQPGAPGGGEREGEEGTPAAPPPRRPRRRRAGKTFKLVAPDAATRLLWVTVLQDLMRTPLLPAEEEEP